MAPDEQTQSATYELPLDGGEAVALASAAEDATASLPASLLRQNVVWFCRLRWLVVAMLAALGLTAFLPGLYAALSLQPHVVWPLATAAVVAAANLYFLSRARVHAAPATALRVRRDLWVQITFDLLVLTAVVHFLGSLETHAAFTYLFHIVLACIFFSPAHSFGVLALASSLYVACLALEATGILPAASVYADPGLRDAIERAPWAAAWHAFSAIGTWTVVWYLASHLSTLVRLRDAELGRTNRRLVEAQLAKMRHMLRTTHELKAPFAAIHANAQLLLRGTCGELPEPALDTVQRISTRCKRLATEIQEMLQLANLRSAEEEPIVPAELDLAEVVGWCVGQAQQAAAEREISVEADLDPAPFTGVEDHLKMLFGNLIANAVAYSHPRGRVEVRCTCLNGQGPQVTVEDQGIGIAPEKLPRIFEEYYRTDEAARHNKESTGLGLAIVQHVAQSHGIRIRVDSRPGAGTKFALTFPLQRLPVATGAGSKENYDGVPAAG